GSLTAHFFKTARDNVSRRRYGAAPAQIVVFGEARMRRLVMLTPLLVLVGCTWLQARKAAVAPAPQVAAVGQRAPDLQGEDMAGQRMHLADHKGQVVLLTF